MVQYLLESTVCSAVFYLIYSMLERKLVLRTKRCYLLLLPLLSVVIPSIEFGQLFESSAATLTGQLSDAISIKEQVAQSITAVVVSIADVLLAGYFLVVAIKGFRLTDGIWKVFDTTQHLASSQVTGAQAYSQFGSAFWQYSEGLDQPQSTGKAFKYWQSFDVLLIEFMSIFLWFNPFIYWFKKELKTTHHVLAEVAPSELAKSNIYPKNLTYSLAPAAFVLMALFSADLSSYLPGNELGNQLVEELDDFSEYKLFEYDKRKQTAQYLEWGKLVVPLDELKSTGGGNHVEMFTISKLDFQNLLLDSMFLRIGDKALDINRLKANIVTKSSPILLYADDVESFLTRIQGFNSDMEFSVYLSLQSADEQAQEQLWLGAFSVSDKQRSYHSDEVWHTLFNRWISVETSFAGTQVSDLAVQSQINMPTQGAKLSINWGDINIPLTHYNGPNQYYDGHFEISLEQLQKNLKAPLTFYENEVQTPFTYLELFRNNRYLNARKVFQTEQKNDQHYIIDAEDKEGDFLSTFKPGSTIRLMGTAGLHSLNYVYIKIHDPYEFYVPDINVNKISREKPTWKFQVVTRRDEKTVLKIDTLNPEVKHILDMYANKEQFEVRHIPGFETTNRVAFAYKNQLGIVKEGDLISNIHLYPEYYDFLTKAIEIRWGDMAALPTSPIVPLSIFEKSKAQLPSLWVDDQEISIISGSFIKQEKDSLTQEIGIANWADFQKEANHLFQGFDGNGSFYLDDLVIEVDNKKYSLPIPFAFHIDKKERRKGMNFEFETTTKYPGVAQKIETDTSIEYINYPLTELIAAFFDSSTKRMFFDNLSEEEYINLKFSAPFYNKMDVNAELDNYIANIYHNTIYRETVDLIHWQLTPEHTDLLDVIVSNETVAEENKIDAFGNGLYLLKDVTPFEIADLMEEKLDIIISTRWYGYHLESKFNLSLDLSSELAAKASLEENGFSFEQRDEYPNARKVTFGQTRSYPQ